MKTTFPVCVLALVVSCQTAETPTSAASASGSISGSGGASSSSSTSASAGGGGIGGYDGGPLEPPDSGAACVPNGGITQTCDDVSLLCPPMCCDSSGCVCFACRLQGDGVRRCVAGATDAGSCPTFRPPTPIN
jgi:hypothetical protein